MADQVYVDASVTSASVIMVGGQCHQRVGGVPVAPQVFTVDGEFDNCGGCGAAICTGNKYYPLFTISGVSTFSSCQYGRYDPNTRDQYSALHWIGGPNCSFVGSGGYGLGLAKFYSGQYPESNNATCACTGSYQPSYLGYTECQVCSMWASGFGTPISGGAAYADVSVGAWGGAILYFRANIPLDSSGYAVPGSYPATTPVGEGSEPYPILGSGGMVTVSYDPPSIDAATLPSSVFVSVAGTQATTTTYGAPNWYCCAVNPYTISQNQTLTPNLIYCPSDNSKVIGVTYSVPGISIAWGAGGGAVGTWVMVVGTSTVNPSLVATSSTLLGTYTMLDPGNNTTITVTA